MSELVAARKPASALVKNRRLGLVLALLVVVYIVAVIIFIVVY